jgi:hypothetical protein
VARSAASGAVVVVSDRDAQDEDGLSDAIALDEAAAAQAGRNCRRRVLGEQGHGLGLRRPCGQGVLELNPYDVHTQDEG